ncbi:MAG: amidohydrolase family protein [Lentisphaeria bacterium]|nr:amidohydrolase family protein [Lentisphaeria bacterium]
MKDCHIHWMPLIGPADPPEVFMKKAAKAGIDGGTVMSLPPVSFRPDPEHSQHWKDRLETILEYTSHTPGFHPFFWIDPTEADAFEQISIAAEAGVRGFKCICNHFYPEECLKQFSAIAETNLPIHFHCGILFDHHASSNFLRPLAFEALLQIKNIRFALAHLGNPWVDECILLYAKFQAAMRNVPGVCKMRVFLDLTPGVSRVRRRDALRMLLLSGYADPAADILWGTDNRINDYHSGETIFWHDFDRKIIEEIFAEIHAAPNLYPALPDDLWERITKTNYADFLGN